MPKDDLDSCCGAKIYDVLSNKSLDPWIQSQYDGSAGTSKFLNSNWCVVCVVKGGSVEI